MKNMVYLKDVVTLQFNEGQCSGCGMCMVVCPHAVFGMNSGRVQMENKDDCMECGACSMNCPTGAISVQSGVGCAAAVINSALGREGSCCCVNETKNDSSPGKNTTCC
jgi:NAD-dependent dihydropyrimidine dehydrogenase PreA subunit